MGRALALAPSQPADPAAKPADPPTPVASPAPSPEAAVSEMGPAFGLRRIDFGVQGVETDTDSSRFREYRDVPTGIFIPFARFAGGEKTLFRAPLQVSELIRGAFHLARPRKSREC